MPTIILYVQGDDGPSLTRLADRPDFTTVTADNATEALKHLQDQEFDCVVATSPLPDLETHQFVARAQETHSNLPIIVLGNAAEYQDVWRVLDAGARDYVPPEEVDRLPDLVHDHLAQQYADDALADHAALKDAVHRITRRITGAGSRDQINDIIVSELRSTGLYQQVWIGSYDTDIDEVSLRTPTAGSFDRGTFGAFIGMETTDFIPEAVSAQTVQSSSEPVYARDGRGGTVGRDPEPKHDMVTAAVPIGTNHGSAGLVIVSAVRPNEIDSAEQALLADIGQIAEFAIRHVGDGEPTTPPEPASTAEPAPAGGGRGDPVGEYTETMIHELRNPLSSAMGYLELGRENADPAAFDQVEASLERIESLLETLASVTRGEPVSDPTSQDLAEAAAAAWETIASDGAELLTEEVVVDADPVLLEYLLSNLFRNAIEHGGSDVTVRVGGTEDGFFVEDDGPGIPEVERERVFDRGYSTNNGMGIGLSIVRDIARAHGWAVTVTERAGGGARFEFTATG